MAAGDHALPIVIICCCFGLAHNVNGCQAKAPTSSGLRAPTLSGQSTNMEEIFNTHDNGCQAKAPTSSGPRAPTLSGQSTNMEQIFNAHDDELTANSVRPHWLQHCQVLMMVMMMMNLLPTVSGHSGSNTVRFW